MLGCKNEKFKSICILREFMSIEDDYYWEHEIKQHTFDPDEDEEFKDEEEE